jgi:hypothetical protein
MFPVMLLSPHWVGVAFIGDDHDNFKGFPGDKDHQDRVMHRAKDIQQLIDRITKDLF